MIPSCTPKLKNRSLETPVLKMYSLFSGLKDELWQHDIHMPRSLAGFNLVATSRALKDSFRLKGMTVEPNNQLQCTYFSMKTEFIKSVKLIRWEPYISLAKSKTVRTKLARFGMGRHWLQVCIGRRHQVDYAQRRCPTCTDCIEDEDHAIFHCRTS